MATVSRRSETIQSIELPWFYILRVSAILVVLFLAFYHLTRYPLPWFDEGTVLNAAKTFYQYHVYAEHSSDGFNYVGSIVSVGPTVIVPISGLFALTGAGLLQARLIMALYLLGTIAAFWGLSRWMGGSRLAWVAAALLVTSRGISLLEYGREALGEVPGLFFTVVGLWLWFKDWERPSWKKLVGAGILLGLAMVTKYEFLLFLAPTLILAWLANLAYYRTAPQRVFLVPGIVSAVCFAAWMAFLVINQNPATISQNIASLRAVTSGAALVFSATLIKQSIQQLLGLKVYLAFLAPVMLYGLTLVFSRKRQAHQWFVLFTFVSVNLIWYAVASVGWLRYAFPGLALASIFVARFFYDLTDGYNLHLSEVWSSLRTGTSIGPRLALGGILLVWLGAMIVIPLAQDGRDILRPQFDAPASMAAYINQNVPKNAVIETWEPEMAFLTNNNYHFPPQLMLNAAVKYMSDGGLAPSNFYDYVQTNKPEYVLVGQFASWVHLYPDDVLASQYTKETQIGGYALYHLKDN
jgi:4-amino-4-deoxy-L-arabinose transferase-like glycosyltransferase